MEYGQNWSSCLCPFAHMNFVSPPVAPEFGSMWVLKTTPDCTLHHIITLDLIILLYSMSLARPLPCCHCSPPCFHFLDDHDRPTVVTAAMLQYCRFLESNANMQCSKEEINSDLCRSNSHSKYESLLGWESTWMRGRVIQTLSKHSPKWYIPIVI